MGDLEQFEDLLLRSARNGDVKTVEDILKARTEGKVNLDISCKGKERLNQTVLMEHIHVIQFSVVLYIRKCAAIMKW